MTKQSTPSKPGNDEAAPPATEQQAAAASAAPLGGGKNPAAVQLGRLGGQKGGPARARKLTQQQRVDIARKAAQARWAKRRRQ
jgi:hypothetical protein